MRNAQYNLDQATVVAPIGGYVTQLFLRPGMIAGSTPAMIFIHCDDRVFSASFPQTVVQRLQPGAEAEITFDAIPRRVFQAKVVVLIDAVSQAQPQASGTLLNPEDRTKSAGLASVNIDIVDDLSGYQLPAGATDQEAVYSEHWRPVAVIRRMLANEVLDELRPLSWERRPPYSESSSIGNNGPDDEHSSELLPACKVFDPEHLRCSCQARRRTHRGYTRGSFP
jgi:hypothetical protein